MDKKILKGLIKDRPLISVEENTTVAAAARVMCDSCMGAILVINQDRLTGIFTERDMVQRVVAQNRDPQTTPISEVMTRSLVTASPDDHHILALRRMLTANCRHLPVVDGQKVVGMVSKRELLAVDVELLEEEIHRHDPSVLFI